METQIERERKFIINNTDKLKKYNDKIVDKYKITQYYLYLDHTLEKRIRKKRDLNTNIVQYRYNEKRGNGDTREEKERNIKKVDFLKHLSNIKSKNLKPIIKTRTVYQIDNYNVEVDKYHNKQYNLDKLIVCEIEFESKIEMINFKPFDFIAKEITYDKRYKNASLFKKINNLK